MGAEIGNAIDFCTNVFVKNKRVELCGKVSELPLDVRGDELGEEDAFERRAWCIVSFDDCGPDALLCDEFHRRHEEIHQESPL